MESKVLPDILENDALDDFMNNFAFPWEENNKAASKDSCIQNLSFSLTPEKTNYTPKSTSEVLRERKPDNSQDKVVSPVKVSKGTRRLSARLKSRQTQEYFKSLGTIDENNSYQLSDNSQAIKSCNDVSQYASGEVLPRSSKPSDDFQNFDFLDDAILSRRNFDSPAKLEMSNVSDQSSSQFYLKSPKRSTGSMKEPKRRWSMRIKAMQNLTQIRNAGILFENKFEGTGNEAVEAKVLKNKTKVRETRASRRRSARLSGVHMPLLELDSHGVPQVREEPINDETEATQELGETDILKTDHKKIMSNKDECNNICLNEGLIYEAVTPMDTQGNIHSEVISNSVEGITNGEDVIKSERRDLDQSCKLTDPMSQEDVSPVFAYDSASYYDPSPNFQLPESIYGSPYDPADATPQLLLTPVQDLTSDCYETPSTKLASAFQKVSLGKVEDIATPVSFSALTPPSSSSPLAHETAEYKTPLSDTPSNDVENEDKSIFKFTLNERASDNVVECASLHTPESLEDFYEPIITPESESDFKTPAKNSEFLSQVVVPIADLASINKQVSLEREVAKGEEISISEINLLPEIELHPSYNFIPTPFPLIASAEEMDIPPIKDASKPVLGENELMLKNDGEMTVHPAPKLRRSSRRSINTCKSVTKQANVQKKPCTPTDCHFSDGKSASSDIKELYLKRGSMENFKPTLLETVFGESSHYKGGTRGGKIFSKQKLKRELTFPEKPWRMREGRKVKPKKGSRRKSVSKRINHVHLDEAAINEKLQGILDRLEESF